MIGRVTFPIELVELEPNDELERDGYRIAAFGVDHGGAGDRLRARGGPAAGPVRPDRARELGVESGPDFGRLQRGEEVNGVRPDQVMGETAAWPQGRAHG